MVRRGPLKIVDVPDYDIDDLNQTELVALARRNDITGASRAVPRELLIAAIRSFEDLSFQDPMYKTKDRLSTNFRKYWSRFRMQVPGKATEDINNMKPGECPNCYTSSDAQVAYCFVMNAHWLV